MKMVGTLRVTCVAIGYPCFNEDLKKQKNANFKVDAEAHNVGLNPTYEEIALKRLCSLTFGAKLNFCMTSRVVS